MIIPDKCIPWIKLQRTGYKDHKEEFSKAMEKEYKWMFPYLPINCRAILDIGCGIGGIDVLLANHYDNPELFLLDNSDCTPKATYGYDRGDSFYNSFDVTRALMRANKIKSCNYIDAKYPIPEIAKVDLAISLLSCGYHYPVDTYLDFIDTYLKKDGTLIMDIRIGTDGIDKVREKFPDIKLVDTYNKADKICAKRIKN